MSATDVLIGSKVAYCAGQYGEFEGEVTARAMSGQYIIRWIEREVEYSLTEVQTMVRLQECSSPAPLALDRCIGKDDHGGAQWSYYGS